MTPRMYLPLPTTGMGDEEEMPTSVMVNARLFRSTPLTSKSLERAKSGPIDETSLSNWPAYKANGWARIVNGECDLELGPCGLRAFQASANSQALKPTLDLNRKAKSMGVAVFFITGRPPNLREATEKNLRDQGFAWDEVILLPADTSFASAVDFKAPERKKIADRGYTILLTMGDQQSDLSGGYEERTFKLPNPVYFLP